MIDVAINVNSSLYLSSYQAETKKTGSNVLDKDAFMKILITQLQNQDPTSPMEDREFIAQMAQFSTLEQMTNMNNSLQRFVDSQAQNQMLSYSQFIGKEVTWQSMEESGEENQESTIEQGSGKVTSIQIKNGSVTLTLEDGTILDPASISEIKEVPKEQVIV